MAGRTLLADSLTDPMSTLPPEPPNENGSPDTTERLESVEARLDAMEDYDESMPVSAGPHCTEGGFAYRARRSRDVQIWHN
jgi:hypothetical protein